jgi:hypothetical protein
VWAWSGDATAVVKPSGSLRRIYLAAPLADGEAADLTAESPT